MNNKEIPLDTSILVVEDNQITFSVNKVEKCKPPQVISGEKAFSNAIDALNKELTFQSKCKVKKGTKPPKFSGIGTLIDSSFKHDKLESTNFLDTRSSCCAAAIYGAYQIHMSVSLSPSDFLLMIGHGLATHINMNAKKLQHYFVDHEGQKTIFVENEKIGLTADSDWSTVTGQVSEEIQKRIKKELYFAVIDDCSTATPTTKILSELNLMDALKNYFIYKGGALCGFPKVQLRGTVDDWKRLHRKVITLKEANNQDCLDIEWWLKCLIPIVEKICEAGIERKVDYQFWGNMCHNSACYGTNFDGWLNTFVPYTYYKHSGYQRNSALSKGVSKDFTFPGGSMPEEINEGLTKVPFIFVNGGCGKQMEMVEIKHPMHFYAGFLGSTFNQDDEFMKPAYFWSVYQDPVKENDGEDEVKEESGVKHEKEKPGVSKPKPSVAKTPASIASASSSKSSLSSTKTASTASGSKVASSSSGKIVSTATTGKTTSKPSGPNPVATNHSAASKPKPNTNVKK